MNALFLIITLHIYVKIVHVSPIIKLGYLNSNNRLTSLPLSITYLYIAIYLYVYILFVSQRLNLECYNIP